MASFKRSAEAPGLIEESGSDTDDERETEHPRKKVKLKTSNVHQEFERINVKLSGGKEELKSKCKHCKSSYSGKNPTTLWKHLRGKHPQKAKEVEIKDNNQRSELMEEKVENNKSGSNQKTAREAFFGDRGRSQNKMENYISVTKVRRSKSLPPRPKEKEETSERMLALWIGGSTLPISFVEDPNFEMFLQSYDPQARTPSRQKLRKLVNNMSNEVRERMTNAMGKARRISVTTDIWSSKGSTDSYIGITTHMANPSTRKREAYRICCRQFNEKHSGINLARKMRRIFVEFSFERKVFRILTDNAANAIKSVQDLKEMAPGEEMKEYEGENSDDSEDESEESECDSEPEDMEDDREVEDVEAYAEELQKELQEHEAAFQAIDIERAERLPCISHTIQLPVNKCINGKKKAFGGVLRKSRKIVKKVKKSPKAKALLKKKYPLALAGYMKTRWWTDVVMAKSVVKAAKAPGNPLNDMMYKMGWNLELTEKDIEALESFISIMTPFHELSDKLGGEKQSTIQLVYPSIKELLALLDEKIEKNEAKAFCKDLKNGVMEYFKFIIDPEHFNFNSIYAAATYLDPFYKCVLDDGMIGVAKDYLKKLVKEEQEAIDQSQLGVAAQREGIHEAPPAMPAKGPNIVLPGFSRLSKEIFTNMNNNSCGGEDKSVEAAIGRDLQLYEKKAATVFQKELAKVEADQKKKAEKKQIEIDLVNESNSQEGTSNQEASGHENEDMSRDCVATVKPQDPLDFWFKQEKTREYESILATLAQDIMAIPATSVPSERTFNISGILSDNKMSSITPENLENRVVIKCNPNLN